MSANMPNSDTPVKKSSSSFVPARFMGSCRKVEDNTDKARPTCGLITDRHLSLPSSISNMSAGNNPSSSCERLTGFHNYVPCAGNSTPVRFGAPPALRPIVNSSKFVVMGPHGIFGSISDKNCHVGTSIPAIGNRHTDVVLPTANHNSVSMDPDKSRELTANRDVYNQQHLQNDATFVTSGSTENIGSCNVSAASCIRPTVRFGAPPAWKNFSNVSSCVAVNTNRVFGADSSDRGNSLEPLRKEPKTWLFTPPPPPVLNPIVVRGVFDQTAISTPLRHVRKIRTKDYSAPSTGSQHTISSSKLHARDISHDNATPLVMSDRSCNSKAVGPVSSIRPSPTILKSGLVIPGSLSPQRLSSQKYSSTKAVVCVPPQAKRLRCDTRDIAGSNAKETIGSTVQDVIEFNALTDEQFISALVERVVAKAKESRLYGSDSVRDCVSWLVNETCQLVDTRAIGSRASKSKFAFDLEPTWTAETYRINSLVSAPVVLLPLTKDIYADHRLLRNACDVYKLFLSELSKELRSTVIIRLQRLKCGLQIHCISIGKFISTRRVSSIYDFPLLTEYHLLELCLVLIDQRTNVLNGNHHLLRIPRAMEDVVQHTATRLRNLGKLPFFSSMNRYGNGLCLSDDIRLRALNKSWNSTSLIRTEQFCGRQLPFELFGDYGCKLTAVIHRINPYIYNIRHFAVSYDNFDTMVSDYERLCSLSVFFSRLIEKLATPMTVEIGQINGDNFPIVLTLNSFTSLTCSISQGECHIPSMVELEALSLLLDLLLKECDYACEISGIIRSENGCELAANYVAHYVLGRSALQYVMGTNNDKHTILKQYWMAQKVPFSEERMALSNAAASLPQFLRPLSQPFSFKVDPLLILSNSGQSSSAGSWPPGNLIDLTGRTGTLPAIQSPSLPILSHTGKAAVRSAHIRLSGNVTSVGYDTKSALSKILLPFSWASELFSETIFCTQLKYTRSCDDDPVPHGDSMKLDFVNCILTQSKETLLIRGCRLDSGTKISICLKQFPANIFLVEHSFFDNTGIIQSEITMVSQIIDALCEGAPSILPSHYRYAITHNHKSMKILAFCVADAFKAMIKRKCAILALSNSGREISNVQMSINMCAALSDFWKLNDPKLADSLSEVENASDSDVYEAGPDTDMYRRDVKEKSVVSYDDAVSSRSKSFNARRIRDRQQRGTRRVNDLKDLSHSRSRSRSPHIRGQNSSDGYHRVNTRYDSHPRNITRRSDSNFTVAVEDFKLEPYAPSAFESNNLIKLEYHQDHCIRNFLDRVARTHGFKLIVVKETCTSGSTMVYVQFDRIPRELLSGLADSSKYADRDRNLKRTSVGIASYYLFGNICRLFKIPDLYKKTLQNVQGFEQPVEIDGLFSCLNSCAINDSSEDGSVDALPKNSPKIIEALRNIIEKSATAYWSAKTILLGNSSMFSSFGGRRSLNFK